VPRKDRIGTFTVARSQGWADSGAEIDETRSKCHDQEQIRHFSARYIAVHDTFPRLTPITVGLAEKAEEFREGGNRIYQKA
jgi:hypothetical protein